MAVSYNKKYYTMKIGEKTIERGYLIDNGLMSSKLNKKTIEDKVE